MDAELIHRMIAAAADCLDPAAGGWARLSHVLMLQSDLMRRLNDPPSGWVEEGGVGVGGWVPAAAQSDWVSILIADFYYAVDHKNLCQCAHYSSKKKSLKCLIMPLMKEIFPIKPSSPVITNPQDF